MAATVEVVALLRGVNVGGKNRMSMTDLSRILGDLGCLEVRTVLQSGNAVFSIPARRAVGIAQEIESAIAGELGLSLVLVVRDAVELRAAVEADPWHEVATDPSKHFIGFLNDRPDPAGVEALELLDLDVDRVAVIGRHVYLWCPNGLSASPLFKFAWDRRFRTPMTMRNLATVAKISGLLAVEGP